MRRNLFSNRQLREFNKLLRELIPKENLYINARRFSWGDHAERWICEDLKDGDTFVYNYADDKAWFHRCATLPLYCGIKGGSIRESKEFRDELALNIQNWGITVVNPLENASQAKGIGPSPSFVRADNSDTIWHWFSINVKFDFPQWHEEDRDSDLLDEDEIHLFSTLYGQEEQATIGMTQKWFNEKGDQFFRDARQESKQKRDIFCDYFSEKTFSMRDTGPYAGGTGMTMGYSDDEEKPEETINFLPLATYSHEVRSFLWIWDNPGNYSEYQVNEKLATTNKELYNRLVKVQNIFNTYGFDEFEANDNELEIDEFESWELLSIAAKELSADMVYKLPASPDRGEVADTYGLMFYNDERKSSFTQDFANSLTRWRKSMKDFLSENSTLNKSSSIAFADNFLASKNGHLLGEEFKAKSSNSRFMKILKLRITDTANEENRFKEVMKRLVESGS